MVSGAMISPADAKTEREVFGRFARLIALMEDARHSEIRAAKAPLLQPKPN